MTVLLAEISIAKRLVICFGCLVGVLVSVLFLGGQAMHALSEQNNKLVNKELSQFLEVAELKGHAEKAAISLLMLITTEERDKRVPLYRSMDESGRLLDEVIVRIKNDPTMIISQDFELARKQYQDALNETVELLELDTAMAAGQFSDTAKPSLVSFLSQIQIMVDSKRKALAQDQLIALEKANRTRLLSLLLGAVGVILSGLLAWFVVKSITSPLNEAVNIAKRIASGDLSSPPKPVGRDEVASLMAAFCDMCSGLQQRMVLIQDNARTVKKVSSDLIEPVAIVHSGSSEQSEAVDRINGHMYIFSQDAEQVSSISKSAKAQSEKARELAVNGKSLIDSVTYEFDKISQTITCSADAVTSLSESAASVRVLVTTVREIAEQTNLLALNAAIEAARAGEAGRGFSVVADEVRGLANRTEVATTQINDVIDAMESETASAVDQIARGRHELESGVVMINQMVSPLNALNENADDSYQVLAQLDDIVERQVKASSDIGDAVAQVNGKANDNAVSVESVKKITATLAEISDELANVVHYFRVD